MKKWFLNIRHIPTCHGVDEGPGIPWAHGREKTLPIPLEDVTADWVDKYGFKTKAAALRALRARPSIEDKYWREEGTVESREVPDNRLSYKIYRCYEIVIVDKDGNEVGECNYCYGTRADAEDMARHELKIARMENP